MKGVLRYQLLLLAYIAAIVLALVFIPNGGARLVVVATLMLVGIPVGAAVYLWRRPHPCTWVFPVSFGFLALLAWGSWQDGNLQWLVLVEGLALLLAVLWVGVYRDLRWAWLGTRWFYGALLLCAGVYYTIQPLRDGEGAFVQELTERSERATSPMPYLAAAVVLGGMLLLLVIFRNPRRAAQLKQTSIVLFGIGSVLVLMRIAVGHDTLGSFPNEVWLDGVVGYVVPILCCVYFFARTPHWFPAPEAGHAEKVGEEGASSEPSA